MAKCLECGSHWSLYIVLLIFLTSVYAGAGPLVLDDASTCSFTSGTENFFFPNKLQRTNQKNNVEVHFNLCDKLPLDICGDDVVACVKHTDGTVPLKGSGWVFSKYCIHE
ncbi:unnamed protein product [Acanthoscelides obtectus]|uniref:Uncharacterized protein n=1 Tax=Acanthoscelides obtectus TaxID=200917 RepID=A0A9P0LAA8_ACAOB|nr:unnamed protein product [Acanthoscelides obtectus]CAK1671511.1 hypothetical protein AOBTE_LOCUS28285 [Acanthoscelides obtectus]